MGRVFRILLKTVAKIILYAVLLTVVVLGIDVVGLRLYETATGREAFSNLFWILLLEGVVMVWYSHTFFRVHKMDPGGWDWWLAPIETERARKLPAHPAMGIAMAAVGCFLFVLGLFCYG